VLRRLLSEFAFLFAVGAAAAGIFVGVLYYIQPNITPDLDLYALNRPASYPFLDKNGNVAGHYGVTVGDRVPLEELPPHLIAAFIAMEDKQFYEHPGFDVRAIVRAAIADYEAGEAVHGGSTITQQLAKMLFYSSERTLARKFRELTGAWALESHLSKDEILELYLNRIYLGSGAYGVDGAAQVYFGKSARDVALAEAAMLAALTCAPSTFTPRRDLGAAQNRAELVLGILSEERTVPATAIAEARANPAEIVDRTEFLERAYFFDASAEEVQNLLPDARGDLIVQTTFDQRMQDADRTALNGILDERGEASEVSQAALVSMATDGALYAIVGGRDYVESQFNRATQARRQPGSSFKPFVYLAALENGLRPTDRRSGGPVNIRGYHPGNYGGRWWGYMTLADALKRSVNTVAVRVGNEIGIRKVAEAAERVGITSPLHTYPSLPLGTAVVSPLEMTSAFSAFANGGLKATPYSVLRVTNPQGETLYERGTPEPQRVIDEDVASTLTDTLYGVVQSGTGGAAQIREYEIAGKTGTSSDWRDAWFIGFTSQLATGVWVGNDDFSPMRRVTGGSIPAQIWNTYMREALEGYEPTPLHRGQRREQRLAGNDVEVIRGLDDLNGNREAREWRDAREDRERRNPYDRFPHGVYVIPASPPVPYFEGPYSAEQPEPDADNEYWRGKNFDQQADFAETQPEGGQNPYEQDWHVNQQAVPDSEPVDAQPDAEIPQLAESAPQEPYQYDRGPEFDRYRRQAPQIYQGRDGLVYSMDPVGR
jgi:penicillin-binding protein 1A